MISLRLDNSVPIYTRDGSSIQTDHPLYDRNYGEFIQTDDRFRRIIPGDSSSGRMIRLFALFYPETNYQTNYRSLNE